MSLSTAQFLYNQLEYPKAPIILTASVATFIILLDKTGCLFYPYEVPDFVLTSKTTSKYFNPYPTAFPYGNVMVLHLYQQQESSTTKTVHKVINKGLKAYV